MENVEFGGGRFSGGGNVETIDSFLLPRRFSLAKPEERLIEVESGIPVLCHCHWQPERRAAGSRFWGPGLGGVGGSQKKCGVGRKALAAGLEHVRFEQTHGRGHDRAAPNF